MSRSFRRWLARWAVPNLTLTIVVLQVAVFLLQFVEPALVEQIAFDRQAILSGQVWRLATFLIMPPTINPVWALIFWWCFLSFGAAVEGQFGTPGYNLYLLIGWLANVGAAMLLPGGAVSNGFLFGTVFLAFAQLFPELELYVFFIIPVKAKWLALVAWVGYFLGFAGGDWATRAMIMASVANFFVFFGGEIWQRIRAGRRRAVYQGKVNARQHKPFHVCQVCGITDRTNPQMEFRYCSQCVGQRGYCSDHLRNHEHVLDPSVALREAS